MPKPPRPPRSPAPEPVTARETLMGMLRLETAASDWFSKMSPAEQEAYKRAHPKSKYAKTKDRKLTYEEFIVGRERAPHDPSRGKSEGFRKHGLVMRKSDYD